MDKVHCCYFDEGNLQLIVPVCKISKLQQALRDTFIQANPGEKSHRVKEQRETQGKERHPIYYRYTVKLQYSINSYPAKTLLIKQKQGIKTG